MESVRKKPVVSGKRSGTGLPPGPSRSTSRPEAVAPSNSARSQSLGLDWTILTDHAHLLLVLSRNPSLVLREAASQVGITQRAAQRIFADLRANGIIKREKIGCRSQYRILAEEPLPDPIETNRTIAELLALFNDAET